MLVQNVLAVFLVQAEAATGAAGRVRSTMDMVTFCQPLGLGDGPRGVGAHHCPPMTAPSGDPERQRSRRAVRGGTRANSPTSPRSH